MPYQLNDKLKSFAPYEPIQGNYTIRLDANESFLSLPPDVLERAAISALKGKSNRYPDPYAKKLCETFGRLYGVKAECVTAGNGSDELISLLMGTFFLPEEKIMLLSDDFSMYRCYGEIYNSNYSVFPKKADLTVDVDGLIKEITEQKIRGLLFSNPCNPTSLCLSHKEVLRLVEAVPDCLVIVDEAYMDFADESVLDDVLTHDNLVVLKTCSKAFGMAAIRLGFAVASPAVTKALRAVKAPYNINAMTQNVGYMVLSEGDYLIDCIGKIIHSRDQLYTGILSLNARFGLFSKVYPTSTNFVYLETEHAKMIFDKLAESSIAIRMLDEKHLRISAGSKKENIAVLDVLDRVAKGLED